VPPPPCCPAARPPRPRPAADATGPASSPLRTRPSGAQPPRHRDARAPPPPPPRAPQVSDGTCRPRPAGRRRPAKTCRPGAAKIWDGRPRVALPPSRPLRSAGCRTTTRHAPRRGCRRRPSPCHARREASESGGAASEGGAAASGAGTGSGAVTAGAARRGLGLERGSRAPALAAAPRRPCRPPRPHRPRAQTPPPPPPPCRRGRGEPSLAPPPRPPRRASSPRRSRRSRSAQRTNSRSRWCPTGAAATLPPAPRASRRGPARERGPVAAHRRRRRRRRLHCRRRRLARRRGPPEFSARLRRR